MVIFEANLDRSRRSGIGALLTEGDQTRADECSGDASRKEHLYLPRVENESDSQNLLIKALVAVNPT
jgi:hypothetical protein